MVGNPLEDCQSSEESSELKDETVPLISVILDAHSTEAVSTAGDLVGFS